DGIAYVEAALRAGLKVDAFASRLSFFFNVHNNFFEEIAKFRAARRLWARIMKERFGAADERSMMLRFHAQTAGSTLTAQQIENQQCERLGRLRAERNAAAAGMALERVEAAARDGGNVMPAIIDAVRNWATLGEISDAMRRVFGEYQPVNVV